MSCKKPAVSRKAASSSRSSSVPTWEQLVELASAQRAKLRPLAEKLAVKCVSFINALHNIGAYLKSSPSYSKGYLLYEATRRRFVKQVEEIRDAWRQIDSRHVFRWKSNLFGLFAKTVANSYPLTA